MSADQNPDNPCLEPEEPELTDEHRDYLERLRRSGETNMWGAGLYLQWEFGLQPREARKILTAWIKERTAK